MFDGGFAPIRPKSVHFHMCLSGAYFFHKPEHCDVMWMPPAEYEGRLVKRIQYVIFCDKGVLQLEHNFVSTVFFDGNKLHTPRNGISKYVVDQIKLCQFTC